MAIAEQSAPMGAAAPIVSVPRKLIGRIGPWQLVRLISESDLARVYLAQPADAAEAAEPAYVLKVLRKEWWRDPAAIEMQRRSAWVGRKVSHPHLLPVLSAGVEQPPYYLVSPRLPGASLAKIMQTRPRLPLSITLWIVRQIAEGLDALHTTCRMIHADVKPSNVVLSPDGHATLVDLGFVHSPCESRHWSTRPVYGTLNYIAPEAITSSLAAEQRSDIYSLGVMLYEMLAGALPFAAADAAQLISMHRESKPMCILSHRPDLPQGAASLVHRMLAKETLRRPESAAAVADELVRLEVECFADR